MKLKGEIIKASHNISRRYSRLRVNIDGTIYKIEIENYPRKGNIYEIEGLEIMLDGEINQEEKKVENPRNIWIRLL